MGFYSYLLVVFTSVALVLMSCSCENKTTIKEKILKKNLEINSKLLDTSCYDIELVNADSSCINLSNIVGKDSVILFLKFDEFNCNLCSESAFKLLDSYNNQLDRRFSVVGRYENLRNFLVFKSMYNSNLKMYATNQVLHDSLDRMNEPYFCVLDNELKVKAVFFPEKTLPNLSSAFLANVIYKLNL